MTFRPSWKSGWCAGIAELGAAEIERECLHHPDVADREFFALRRAFNFEEINRELFYNQYKRIVSYFEGTDLAAAGLPSDREHALLQPLRSEIPPEVFTTPYSNPVAGSEQAARHNLCQAMRLFSAAGFEVRDLVLVDTETGEPMRVEFLVGDPSLERVILFYQPALQRLGIAFLLMPSVSSAGSRSPSAPPPKRGDRDLSIARIPFSPRPQSSPVADFQFRAQSKQNHHAPTATAR
jgi:ABC-type oligopeptide transport system substrate-binding subunit